MNHANFLDYWIHSLDPMRAEVRVRLRQPDGVVRGQVMGPRSRFTTTLEIAYPFRPLSSPTEFSAIVPEPSLWIPAKPFIYEGPIERTEASGASEKAWVRLCFHTVNLGPKGLMLNGQLLKVCGKELAAIPTESELLELHRQGFNALLPHIIQPEIKELADRLGFLLMQRERPGDNGEETVYYLSSEQADPGRIELPGILRRADGSFEYG